MPRRLVSLCVTPLVIAGVCAVAATGEAGWGVAVLATLLIAGCVSFLFRHSSGFNPVYVCVMLLAGTVLAVAVVRAMTVFPPFPLLAVAACAAAGALVATAFAGKRVRDRRALAGLCAECGYDLRESDARCPECGAAIPEELARRRRIAADLLAKRDAERGNATVAAPPPAAHTPGQSGRV